MKKKILIPVITPFKENEEVDYAALAMQVKKVLAEGADGIYAGGSSAECFSLSADERKKTLKTIVDAAEGAYVVAHVAAPSTYLAKDLAVYAKSLGVDELASVPPIYFKFSLPEIKGYYKALHEATGLPIMVYSVANAGYEFGLNEYLELLDGDYVKSLKFTVKDYYILERLKARTDKFIYSGSDECLLSALAQGADGAIGSLYNFLYPTARLIADNFDKNIAVARAEQAKLNEILERALFPYGVLSAIKYILQLQGIPAGVCRAPFRRLTDENKKDIERIYKELF